MDTLVVVNAGETGRMPYPTLTKNLHHEIELVVAIGQGGRGILAADAMKHVYGYAVGLDMTRRDLQNDMKKQGRPWCIGKGFDHSAPIGSITPAAQAGDVLPCRHQPAGQRPAAAGQPHPQADLEHRRDHRAPVRRLGAAGRRPGLHRHARGRGGGGGR